MALLVAHARRLLPHAWAAVAGLALLTCPLVFGDSRVLSTDLFQLFFLTWALLLLYEGTLGRGDPVRVALALALLGASMLAKGPIALLVAAAIVAPYLALSRGSTRLPLAGVGLGLVLFAAIGLPWYAVMVADDPARVQTFLVDQLLGRAAGGGRDTPTASPTSCGRGRCCCCRGRRRSASRSCAAWGTRGGARPIRSISSSCCGP